mmetsp:Transcript_1626/g.4201  ORF Transcript_1626/g.4201 Transcript_1626/m.4201 type:complete len:344 (+) Transcript_1626:407-1438(+)
MVPPLCVVEPSGMNTTTGVEVLCSNSVELAPSRPSTLRQNSTTAICIPRQMPRKGFFAVRAWLMAQILPSTPRLPKPPGTSTPPAVRSLLQASSYPAWLSALVDSSRWSASIQTISSLLLALMQACCSALMTDRYASDSPVYLPTMAILTSSLRLSQRSASVDRQWARSRRSAWDCGSPRCFMSVLCTSWSAMMSGTRQMLLTSCMVSTLASGTWQNSDSLLRTLWSSGSEQRHAIMRGLMPRERSTATLCCVGLVFCSPTTPRMGTRLTCTLRKLASPTRNWNWRSASTNGMDSMSPTVPPSSMTQTSGTPSWPSTGMCATRSIQSWMASVMCGTTCTVLPR